MSITPPVYYSHGLHRPIVAAPAAEDSFIFVTYNFFPNASASKPSHFFDFIIPRLTYILFTGLLTFSRTSKPG